MIGSLMRDPAGPTGRRQFSVASASGKSQPARLMCAYLVSNSLAEIYDQGILFDQGGVKRLPPRVDARTRFVKFFLEYNADAHREYGVHL